MPARFETVKSFDDVLVTAQGVDILTFLEASDGLMDIFDLFGSVVFAFVQSDLRSNITGVRACYESRAHSSPTLEMLVAAEHADKQRQGTACLVRLIRGLSFTCVALQEAQRDHNAELHVCFRRAYDKVLKHHHAWVVRSVVTLAIRAVPHRSDFYKAIAEGQSQDKLSIELEKWLGALDSIVLRISTFLSDGGYGRV